MPIIKDAIIKDQSSDLASIKAVLFKEGQREKQNIAGYSFSNAM